MILKKQIMFGVLIGSLFSGNLFGNFCREITAQGSGIGTALGLISLMDQLINKHYSLKQTLFTGGALALGISGLLWVYTKKNLAQIDHKGKEGCKEEKALTRGSDVSSRKLIFSTENFTIYTPDSFDISSFKTIRSRRFALMAMSILFL